MPSKRPPRAAATHAWRPKPDPIRDATDADLDAVVAASAVPVLVALWAPDSEPCAALNPRLAKVAAKLAGEIRVVKVDVDENPELADRFDVQSIPLLVLLRGARRDALIGLHPVAEIEAWVRARLKGRPEPAAAPPRLRGRPPTLDQLVRALRQVPGLAVEAKTRSVLVHISTIDLELRLPLKDVLQLELVEDPWGHPAVALLLGDRGQPRQVVVSARDLAFEPDTSDTRLDASDPVQVDGRGIPAVVGDAEMRRELAAAGAALAREPDLDRVDAALVRLRCFIRGARRVGVDCRAAFAAWEKLRAAFDLP